MPSHFDDAGSMVNEKAFDEQVRISSDLNQHLDWLLEYKEMGFEQMSLHNVNRDQEPFIDAFGENVLPKLV